MKTFRALLTIIFILGVSMAVFAAESMRTATLIELTGSVEVRTAEGRWAPAKAGMALTQGDSVRTKAGSGAILDLNGSAETAKIEISEKSEIKLAELLEDKTGLSQKTLLDLALGKILVRVQKLASEGSKFEVKTPTSIVGVRGTTFSVAVEAVE